MSTPGPYRIVAISTRSGARECLSLEPMGHREALTMLGKFSDHPARRIQLEEFKPCEGCTYHPERKP